MSEAEQRMSVNRMLWLVIQLLVIVAIIALYALLVTRGRILSDRRGHDPGGANIRREIPRKARARRCGCPQIRPVNGVKRQS